MRNVVKKKGVDGSIFRDPKVAIHISRNAFFFSFLASAVGYVAAAVAVLLRML